MATGTISHPNSLHRVSTYNANASTTASLTFPRQEVYQGNSPSLFGFLVITRYVSSSSSYSSLYYLTMGGNAIRASEMYTNPNIQVSSFELSTDAVLTVTFSAAYQFIQVDAYYVSLS